MDEYEAAREVVKEELSKGRSTEDLKELMREGGISEEDINNILEPFEKGVEQLEGKKEELERLRRPEPEGYERAESEVGSGGRSKKKIAAAAIVGVIVVLLLYHFFIDQTLFGHVLNPIFELLKPVTDFFQGLIGGGSASHPVTPPAAEQPSSGAQSTSSGEEQPTDGAGSEDASNGTDNESNNQTAENQTAENKTAGNSTGGNNTAGE